MGAVGLGTSVVRGFAQVIATGIVINAEHIATGDTCWQGVEPRVTVLDPRQL
jgi:hypothetical protein